MCYMRELSLLFISISRIFFMLDSFWCHFHALQSNWILPISVIHNTWGTLDIYSLKRRILALSNNTKLRVKILILIWGRMSKKTYNEHRDYEAVAEKQQFATRRNGLTNMYRYYCMHNILCSRFLYCASLVKCR